MDTRLRRYDERLDCCYDENPRYRHPCEGRGPSRQRSTVRLVVVPKGIRCAHGGDKSDVGCLTLKGIRCAHMDTCLRRYDEWLVARKVLGLLLRHPCEGRGPSQQRSTARLVVVPKGIRCAHSGDKSDVGCLTLKGIRCAHSDTFVYKVGIAR